MDIIVEGIGKKYCTPEEVEVRLDFYTKERSYEKALKQGTKDVEIFIDDILYEMNFTKEDLKTRSFRVYEETRYDYNLNETISLGYYTYTQDGTLKFDYSIERMAEFMDRVSKMKNPPKYQLSFNVKDIKQSKKEVLSEAYNEAKSKAEAIASAAGKNLKECVKIDFRTFEERVVSNSGIGSNDVMFDMAFGGETEDRMMFKKTRTGGAQETIQTIFTPEDVAISETLYCLWITD